MIRLAPVDRIKNRWLRSHARMFEYILIESNTPYLIDERLEVQEGFVEVSIDGKSMAFLTKIKPVIDKTYDRFDLICSPYSIFPQTDERVFALCSSAYDGQWRSWDQYRRYCAELVYDPLGERKILSYVGNEDPGKAPYRPAAVKMIDSLGRPCDLSYKSFHDFISQINTCFVAVGCPGVTQQIIDRAPLQWMSFGCCVIHPKCNYPFPGGVLVPNKHYIVCKDDYSDLPELCVDSNIGLFQHVGENVKKYFKRFLTPTPLWNYIRNKVNS